MQKVLVQKNTIKQYRQKEKHMDGKNSPSISQESAGIVVDGREMTFVGIPLDAFIQTPSIVGDQQKVPLYFVKEVDHPPQGGFLSYREAHAFPFKGIVTPDIIDRVNVPKRILRDDAAFAFKHWYYWAWNLLIPFWRVRFLWDVAEQYANYSFHFLRRFYIKPATKPAECGMCIYRNLSEEDKKKTDEWCAANPGKNGFEYSQKLSSFEASRNKGCPGWYSPMVKEFLRACRVAFLSENLNKKITDKQRWIIDKVVLAFGMFLECDDSYRYRVQDILGELQKEKFYKNPSKELGRLFYVLHERGYSDVRKTRRESAHDGVAERVAPLVIGLRAALFLFPSWKRVAKRFIVEIDLEKVRLDEGDRYHCMVRPDYKYGGIPFEERLAERKRIDGEMFNKNPQAEFMK